MNDNFELLDDNLSNLQSRQLCGYHDITEEIGEILETFSSNTKMFILLVFIHRQNKSRSIRALTQYEEENS